MKSMAETGSYRTATCPSGKVLNPEAPWPAYREMSLCDDRDYLFGKFPKRRCFHAYQGCEGLHQFDGYMAINHRVSLGTVFYGTSASTLVTERTGKCCLRCSSRTVSSRSSTNRDATSYVVDMPAASSIKTTGF